jgi:hypothetical protein
MSADRVWLAGVLLLCCAAAMADDLPDEAFLDYLGSWDGSDEEWQMFDETDAQATDEQADSEGDPAPQGEESTETEDDD